MEPQSEEKRVAILRHSLWQTHLNMLENHEKVGLPPEKGGLTREQCDEANKKIAMDNHTWMMKCLVSANP